MSSKTQIANIALGRIGVQQTLTNVDTDGTLPALTALNFMDAERDFVLRDFNWRWATLYSTLGGGTASPNPDWKWSYPFPAGAIFVRRIATSTGRMEPNPPAFQVGMTSDGTFTERVFTDAATGSFECTAALTDYTKLDSEFVSMLAWRLAADLGLGLSRIENISKTCLEMYAAEKQQCQERAAREAQKDIVDNTNQAVLDIVNLALMRLGVTKDNDLKAAADVMAQGRLVQKAYIFERDFVLRDFPWKWATAYTQGVLVAGDPSAPVSREWIFAYRYPPDGVFIRDLTVSTQNTGVSTTAIFPGMSHFGYRRHDHPFSIGSDNAGQLIYTNLACPMIEYTRKLTSDAEFDQYDRTFTSMLAWRLAVTLAPSRVDPKLVDRKIETAINGYLLEKSQAQAANLNEGAKHRDDDAEWIAARDGLRRHW